MNVYTQASRYAFKLVGYTRDGTTFRDILHRAFLYYHDKYGKNLFEQPLPFVFRAIKLTWFWHLQDDHYYWNKVRYRKQYYKLPTGYIDEGIPEDIRLSNTYTPLDEVSSNDFLDRIDYLIANYHSGHNSTTDPKLLQEYVKLVKEGYKLTEIAEIMGKKPQNISNYKNKVKSIMLIDSPFNGNKLKCKKITKKEYELHPEKYVDYVYDTDRYSDYNEYYKQLTHKDKNEGLLIVLANKKDL